MVITMGNIVLWEWDRAHELSLVHQSAKSAYLTFRDDGAFCVGDEVCILRPVHLLGFTYPFGWWPKKVLGRVRIVHLFGESKVSAEIIEGGILGGTAGLKVGTK